VAWLFLSFCGKGGQYHAGLALCRPVEIVRRGQAEWTCAYSDFRAGKAIYLRKVVKKISDGNDAANAAIQGGVRLLNALLRINLHGIRGQATREVRT
jgi:hypothetical protein